MTMLCSRNSTRGRGRGREKDAEELPGHNETMTSPDSGHPDATGARRTLLVSMHSWCVEFLTTLAHGARERCRISPPRFLATNSG